jgi:hypothetical protein
MIQPPTEQRNFYKGSPERPWIRLRLNAPNGSAHELELLADTGNPCSLIISRSNMAALKLKGAANLKTNFGQLFGGWLELAMPELGLTQTIRAYASDKVVTAVKNSSPDFQGLAGLPLLRLLEYGGDANAFWIRKATKP